MLLLMPNLAALAVAILYYLWRTQYQRRRRILRQRVASLLFAVADQIHNSDSGLSATRRS
jgi:hypothetical protein